MDFLQRRVEPRDVLAVERILQRGLDDLGVEDQGVLLLLHRVVAKVVEQDDAEQRQGDEHDEQEGGDEAPRDLGMEQGDSSSVDARLPAGVSRGRKAAVNLLAARLLFGDVFGQLVAGEVARLGRLDVGLEGAAEHAAE